MAHPGSFALASPKPDIQQVTVRPRNKPSFGNRKKKRFARQQRSSLPAVAQPEIRQSDDGQEPGSDEEFRYTSPDPLYDPQADSKDAEWIQKRHGIVAPTSCSLLLL
jgi:hypothetical protein